MQYVFSESLKDAYAENGGRGLVDLWIRTMMDAGQSLVYQHLESQKERISMKTKSLKMITQNKDILSVLIVASLLLLLPLLGMQFNGGVNWSLMDFATAGILLVGTGLMYVLLARRAGNLAYRAAVGIALGAALLLLWINLAVGIIGSEDNPANWLYVGVLVVGFMGAILARFQPRGMARAMFLTALAQALATAIGMMIWKPEVNSAEAIMGFVVVIGVNVFFITLFLASALLFRRASVASNRLA
jgi:hypothetical protein